MQQTSTYLRHPEVRAKRASKDGGGTCWGGRPSRAACRGHLRVTGLVLLALTANPLLNAAHAQSDYPNKPITLVIALPPGGSNDIMARAVADKMGAALGQQIVVENRASAGSGTVTTRAVARGPADGYTLLLGYTSTLATGPHMFANVGYDVRQDFAPVGLIAMAPALILVHPSVPYRSVADLIADMRAAKEPFQVGTPGVSTVNHLSALLFAQQAGVKLQYIPYKGSGPLNTELIGGFIKVGFNPIPVSRGAIEGKLIRPLAATSLKRASAFPDLPTVAESGLPGYDAVLTYGIVAPSGTPRPIVDKLNKVLRDALATDEVKRRLAQEGAEPMPTTPEEHAAILDREDSKWSAIIKSAGLHPQ
jgi:tripartite-type tricarboxylate transporter receptor subunit TctC